MMERQVSQLVHLVDDLLDVSRVTSGKITLRSARVDLRDVADAAVETSRPLIDAARHQFEVRLPDGPLPLDGDKTRLAQVLTNLLNNAVKYTPEAGRIELSAARDGDSILVKVADSGVGLPADMLPKVFDVFTQVGRSIDRSQGGLGLGLALVKKLVEMHGGEVWAESAGPGQGSTFSFRLPLASTRPATAHADPAAVAAAAGRGRRILVVDDNQDAADSLVMLLELGGHEVAAAYGGPAAVDLALRFRPDVVFLDIGLPGMNGYEVAERLRSDETLNGAVLVALTGWGTDDDRARSKTAGFDHHMTKPVEAAQVSELLRRIPVSSGHAADMPLQHHRDG